MKVCAVVWDKKRVKILDQTLLPQKCRYMYCRTPHEIWGAIRKLQVRGAPAIGIAAGMGLVLGVERSCAKTPARLLREIDQISKHLATARPTAVNVFYVLEHMRSVARESRHWSVRRIKEILRKESQKILNEDRAMCRRMGEYGAKLIRKGDGILTHCNTGALATGGEGTALAVIYRAHSLGKRIRVFADETRPLLQGARLTTWELMQVKVDVTLICDNMAAHVLGQGLVQKIFVGADRIAANGDTANKIGTYGLAVLAREHNVPFYVVAPSSTFDLGMKTGKCIPIEERDQKEVRSLQGAITAPPTVKVYNPAFDVTPAKWITAIVTDRGIIRKPFRKNIARLIQPGKLS